MSTFDKYRRKFGYTSKSRDKSTPLEYYADKFGYNRPEGPYTQDQIMNTLDDSLRKKEEERRRVEEFKARRKREIEEAKKKEKLNAIKDVFSFNQPKVESFNPYRAGQQANQSFLSQEPTNRTFLNAQQEIKPKLPTLNELADNNIKSIISPYKRFSDSLETDVSNKLNMNKMMGMDKETSRKSIVPKEDSYIKDRLDKIESKLRVGEETTGYNIKEGWWETEIQNMLSEETTKEINGQPNEKALIEDFMRKHPELSMTKPDNIPENIWKSATRTVAGNLPRFLTDRLVHQAQSPMTYIIPATLTAASLIAAPFTGGATLAATPLVASPFVLGGASKFTNLIATMTPLAAMKWGMSASNFDYMAQNSQAKSYNELTNKGIDKRIAKPIA